MVMQCRVQISTLVLVLVARACFANVPTAELIFGQRKYIVPLDYPIRLNRVDRSKQDLKSPIPHLSEILSTVVQETALASPPLAPVLPDDQIQVPTREPYLSTTYVSLFNTQHPMRQIQKNGQYSSLQKPTDTIHHEQFSENQKYASGNIEQHEYSDGDYSESSVVLSNNGRHISSLPYTRLPLPKYPEDFRHTQVQLKENNYPNQYLDEVASSVAEEDVDVNTSSTIATRSAVSLNFTQNLVPPTSFTTLTHSSTTVTPITTPLTTLLFSQDKLTTSKQEPLTVVVTTTATSTTLSSDRNLSESQFSLNNFTSDENTPEKLKFNEYSNSPRYYEDYYNDEAASDVDEMEPENLEVPIQILSDGEPIPSTSAEDPIPSTSAVNVSTANSSHPHEETTEAQGPVSADAPGNVELDSEILNIFGEDPSVEKIYGKDIQTDLAVRLQHIVTKGLSNDIRKELMEKYLPPSNCTLVDSPALNLEIKAAVSDLVLKRDKGIELKQKQLGCAISCLANVVTQIISKDDKDTEVIKMLMDSIRLLCDNQHADSVVRRNFILHNLKKDMKDQLQKTAIDKYLFGTDLAETLKIAKTITKTGAELKSTISRPPATTKKTPPPPQSSFQQRNNLNWRAPPPGRRQMGTQRTREPAPRNPPANTSRGSFRARQSNSTAPPPRTYHRSRR